MIQGLSDVERARRYLAVLPGGDSGNRGHDATFRAAAALVHGFALNEDAAYALMASEFNPRCRPPWSAAELAHKVRSALASPSSKPSGYLLGDRIEPRSSFLPGTTAKWPEPNLEAIQRVVAAGPTALELWERSPYPLQADDGSNCEEIVRTLFSTEETPDPLLCVGKSSSMFATRLLSKWVASGKLPDASLIVPSPMNARTGRAKKGHESEHTLENTGPRRFLVVEFDKGSENDHAARLWSLAQFGPLALVVHSGGKSLHGWFYCQGQAEDDLHRFMRHAVELGADKATWSRSQFVRLPAGLRDTGARQSVFFFDPAAIHGEEEI